MNHVRFLRVALLGIAIPALVVLFLPVKTWPVYVSVAEPLALLIGSILALNVSFMYRKQLRAAFVSLAAFLFIYMLAIILFLSPPPYAILTPHLRSFMTDAELLSFVQGIQFINYAMLFFFCLNILKVVDVRQLNRNGWVLFALTSVFSIFLAIYPELELIKQPLGLRLPVISYITIRVFDAGLIIVLMPVLWLYVQYLKSRQRQSLTFTVVIFGIVCATLFDYLFQLVLTVFPNLLAEVSPLRATIQEMLFIYGYLIIAVGLYAHRRQDEWGYNMVDKVLSGKLELVDVS